MKKKLFLHEGKFEPPHSHPIPTKYSKFHTQRLHEVTDFISQVTLQPRYNANSGSQAK